MNKRLSMDNKETDILWKISEGDLQALESLFLEYQPKLVAFIDKFISDPIGLHESFLLSCAIFRRFCS